MWSSGQFHHPSNLASDNDITKIDHPIQTTHHYIVSHGPNDNAHIHAGNVNQPTLSDALGPIGIGQTAPAGSLYLNTTLDDPHFGRHTVYMNRGNNDWQAVSEKIVYSVVQYGAIADGVTDCTTSFQRCLDAAQSMQTNYSMAKVWIPRGNYLLTSRLLINKSGRITIEGEPASVLFLDNADGTYIQIDAPYVAIRNIRLQPLTSGQHTNGTAILVNNNHIQLNDVTIDQPYCGIHVKRGVIVSIRNCFINNPDGTYGIRVGSDTSSLVTTHVIDLNNDVSTKDADYQSYIRVSNCHISNYNPVYTLAMGSSFRNKGAWTENTVYEENSIVFNSTNNSWYAVKTPGTSGTLIPSGTKRVVDLTDGTVVWNWVGQQSVGILLDTAARDVHIEHNFISSFANGLLADKNSAGGWMANNFIESNYISTCWQAGVSFLAGQSCNISSNAIEASEIGIEVAISAGGFINVSNNTIPQYQKYGISLRNPSTLPNQNILVSGNTLNNNPAIPTTPACPDVIGGIFVDENTNDIIITNNRFQGEFLGIGTGLIISSSCQNVIVSNNIADGYATSSSIGATGADVLVAQNIFK
jgi:hypothetical protein